MLRYSRHILLDEIGIEGQNRICSATALIVGVGGLGCPAALYLAAAGVGRLILVDDDFVDLTNLQRQILHTEAGLGTRKVSSAAAALKAINPTIELCLLDERLTAEALAPYVSQADVVLDASDNFATRYAINRICRAAQTPLVSGAAIRFEGQLATFDFRQPDSPCYACLFPDGHDVETENCATMGVFSPLTGVIGTLMAAETLKLLAPCGQPLQGQMVRFDARTSEWRTLRLVKDPGCEIC
ncbi:MAG: HesA/MoeB/ThiF family protein [Burkholderiaceae bacterium]